MWRRAIVAAVASVSGLPDTQVSLTSNCVGPGCLDKLVFDYPNTIYPVTPRFDFQVSGSIPDYPLTADGISPIYTAEGSLGLPNLPLGIFGFEASGPACGEQKFYLENGVLAAITVVFPDCPWTGDVNITGHVDVWTTVPAVPIVPGIGIATGFTANIKVTPPTPPTGAIRSRESGKCLDLPGEDTTNGNMLWTWECNGLDSQKWDWHDSKIHYATDPSKCVDLGGNNRTNGNRLLIWDCALLRPQQKWGFDPVAGTIWLATSEEDASKCIDLADGGTADGTPVQIWDCLDSINQEWQLDSPTTIVDMQLGLAQPAGTGADPTQDVCQLDLDNMPEYPPPVPEDGEDNVTLPEVEIDLDKSAYTRWNHVVVPLANEIKDMINVFLENLPGGAVNSTLVRTILDLGAGPLLAKLPTQQANEIRGISDATGIDVAFLFVYNIMYEVMGLCTSIVAQDEQGHVYHARNLDFGLFMGDDPNTHNWKLTPKLRPLLFNAKFMRDGKLLYRTTQYAGYVGLLTGMKENGFSITVDTRFDAHLDVYLIQWLRGSYDGEFLSFKTREVMETELNYDDALNALALYKPMGPAYIILGGAKQDEGAVITLSPGSESALDVRTLQHAHLTGGFYVLETNYDWPAAPPAFDDRRYPAMDCLEKVGSKNIAFETLWGIMSSNPTKNAITTYTTLMDVASGRFEAYKQFCKPGPDCVPFLGGSLFPISTLHTPPEFTKLPKQDFII